MGSWFEDEGDDNFNMENIMARHQSMEEELELEELNLERQKLKQEQEGQENPERQEEAEKQEDREYKQEKEKNVEIYGNYPPEQWKEWESVIEAVLFTMGSSVSLKQLGESIGQDMKTAWAALQRLKEEYDRENRGVQIIELEDSAQMCTRSCYYENLIRVAASPKKQVLTDIMLETLSIIAYKQPVTKAEIEKIRGVKSDHAVNKLIEYNLVYEAGKLDAPGRPSLFATTEEFLRRFGVSSLNELPELTVEQVEEFRQEAEEELQYTSEEKENKALKEE